MNFAEHAEIRLSTLSPVHIGCGEDYEPTNFVIQDGALYHFEPSEAALPKPDRDALLKLVDAPHVSLASLRKFFKDHSQHFLPHTRRIVPVTPAVEAHYQKSFTDQQARTDAKLEIDRTFYNPFDGQPVIPGSSIKGAIRTAVLDELNGHQGGNWRAKQHAEMQRELMGGSFHTDPLRLFKVSDARYLTPNRIGSKILFAVSRRKKTKILNGRPDDQGKGIPTYKECLPDRQHRAFALTLEFAQPIAEFPEKQPRTDKVLLRNFRDLAKVCNRFYRSQLTHEIALLQGRGFLDPEWSETLLRELRDGELGQRLEAGEACLLRVGRHSGAVAMTLNGNRQIKIMQAREMPPTYEQDTRQIWLAADRKDAASNMLPFGWVLLEPASAGPIAGLRAWFDCATQENDGWLQPRLAQLDQWCAKIETRQADLAAKAAHAAEQAAAERAEAERRASLSAGGLAIEELKGKFAKLAEHNLRERSPGEPVCSAMRALMAQALDPANGWSDVEKRELAQLCREQAKARLTLGGKEKEIKAQWRRLAGEE